MIAIIDVSLCSTDAVLLKIRRFSSVAIDQSFFISSNNLSISFICRNKIVYLIICTILFRCGINNLIFFFGFFSFRITYRRLGITTIICSKYEIKIMKEFKILENAEEETLSGQWPSILENGYANQKVCLNPSFAFLIWTIFQDESSYVTDRVVYGNIALWRTSLRLRAWNVKYVCKLRNKSLSLKQFYFLRKYDKIDWNYMYGFCSNCTVNFLCYFVAIMVIFVVFIFSLNKWTIFL